MTEGLIDRLEIRGPFGGISGYDRQVRSFVRALAANGVRIQLDNVQGWSPHLVPGLDPWFETLTEPVGADIVLHFCMPHQALVVPGRRNVNYTMFEGSRIHRSWVAQAYAHDLVVVPTASSREAWIASGVPPERVAICPLGVDPAMAAAVAPIELHDDDGRPLHSYRTRMLHIAQVVTRKNLDGLLRVWLAATRRADDAILVLKLDTNAETIRSIPERLAAAGAQVGRAPEDAAPVVVLDAVLSDEDMAALFAACSHYVSLSLGEGWDMPMVEAAVAGLELLAPWHSAYRAYLDSDSAHLFDAHPEPVLDAGRETVLFQGASWWRPDERQATEVVQALVSGRLPRKPPPRDRILETLTWERTGARLQELLSDLPEQGPRRRPAPYDAVATGLRRALRSAPRLRRR